MTMQEFSERTGFYPTVDLYAGITKAYEEFPGDKNEFCAAYADNVDGLAENITDSVNRSRYDMEMTTAKRQMDTAAQIAELSAEIDRLQERLEREEEWRPYEEEGGITQSFYEALSGIPGIVELTDEDAADKIAQELGFNRDRIEICRDAPKLEINRHNRIRETGRLPRKPLFCAWDCHYIRFTLYGRIYELRDNDLHICYF